ncbi:MAG: threonine--tRNA ligase [Desulfurococcus sp.]|nr:threonine--tRNA ligase [Desulfurococcus sp.]
MRLLLIHARRFSYEVLEPAVEEPEPVEEKNLSLENALIVFTSIERGDDSSTISSAISEITSVYNQVKASSIVIYPYAHLSQDLAPPFEAVKILRELYENLSRSGIRVYKAPFGWYKSFTLECYGHPLSELSRSIKGSATTARRVIEKRFYIMTPDGALHDPSSFDYTNYPELKVLVDKEVFGRELPGGENKVNEYCGKFGFEWEPMSDHGHMRYGPHAAAIMESVIRYSWSVARSLGIPVFKVMGSNMFNLKERPVYEHAVLFGDRLYEVGVDEDRFVLRYAACHQQFAMLRDWVISYKDLPFGMFEVADSYRLEQEGEVALCFRLRKFYMPDLHILTRNLSEAVEVSLRVQAKIHEEAGKLGRRYVALYNVTEGFLRDHRDKLLEFVRRESYPVLISVIPSGIYYWVLNVEYHIIDNLKRPREIATFQIDVGNGERFNISYVDEKGEKHFVVIIHTAILGGVERYIYMVLDTAAQMEASGQTPYIPTWMSPIQVRIIPVSKAFNEQAFKIAEEISRRGFRVDVDDRDESLGRKIRDAGREWIPYMIVVGEREVATGTVNVRFRRSNDQRVMKLEEFIELLEKEVEGYPLVEATLPLRVSSRPVFSYGH